ncbi:MAG: PGDYG domain-containing protein [Elusimicrobiota bacterium]|jgi:hypothetical protein|nr:PGDYG domain-containing protein [Elusimicrobiota bacterium]
MSVQKYRNKLVVIEAIQYQREDNIIAVQNFVGNDILRYNEDCNEYYIKTEGENIKLLKGDYIIKPAAGEFYVCKPDMFEARYEKVGD